MVLFSQDGLIEQDGSAEIPTEVLPAPVLSSCKTGAGKIRRGEGLVGLYRAFLFAGTPSLVLSTWNAEDRATSAIMKAFYTNLESGLNKSSALRKAKLDFLQSVDPIKRDPYYWAPFILVGNWHPISLPNQAGTSPFLMIALSCVLFATGLLLLQYRTAKRNP